MEARIDMFCRHGENEDRHEIGGNQGDDGGDVCLYPIGRNQNQEVTTGMAAAMVDSVALLSGL
jgi:hypothetical protein